MCGRYTLTRQDGIVEDLQASLDGVAAQSEWWKPRFNVAPTQPAPVITLHDGVRTIEMMRWGLLPHWAGRDGNKPPLMINARVESIDAKPFFRDALKRKRCLVPADGFFEWKREGKGKTATKQPLYFHPSSKKMFAFAGLWARLRTDAGEIHSFTIITGQPNDLVKPVHDRMPIVLAESAYAAWLDPTLDADGAHALLGIPPVGDWIAEPVGKQVNSAANDDPSCIEPVDVIKEEPRQRSLFD
jgi:putative SOS response-associated peptidase YedK